MDTVTKKKGNGKTGAADKTAAQNGRAPGRKTKTVELTEEEIKAEKRRKLTLKVFRLVYEDHQKKSHE